MKGRLSKVLTSLVAATMVVAMTAGVTGCSSSSKSSSSSTTDDKQELKLDVFSMTANTAGPQQGWFAKVIKDKFNIKLNIIASNLQGGDSKYATMMASGNLGDIIVLGDDQKYTDAIKAGYILDWTKDGLLDKYGKDIVKEYPKAIQKNKTNFGKGKSVYGLGHGVSTMPATSPSEGNTMTYGPDLRWDLYEKLGKPPINTMDDLLPVLKQMQQLDPKSDTGKPTYAFSMWNDWDGNMMCLAKQFGCMYGYDELGFLLVSANEDKYQDILDPNGYYIKTLKFYNKANQMGLVDPDSISQKNDNAGNKMRDGQILFSWFPWWDNTYNTVDRVNQGKGFKFVPIKDQKMYSYGFANYGGNRIITIGSKTKDPARVMKFIDWLYTPEGIMVSNYGPKGLTWDVKDGKPVLTDFGKKALPNNDVQVPANYGGGSFKDGVNAMNYQTVVTSSIDPDFNEPYDYTMWKSTLASGATKLDKDWSDAMGAQTQKDYLVKNKMIAVSPVTQFTPANPDTATNQKLSQVKAVIIQDSWKMVFAKNDSEFNSILKDMTTKAKGLGYDDVVKFYVGQAQKTFEARKTVK